MFELKLISAESIPAALSKAERYRLLNEPREAESICEDVLRIDSQNRDAIVTMLLALTDQFGHDWDVDIGDARELLPRLHDGYEQAYYAGVICERWGKAQLARGVPGYAAYDWFRQAMGWYEKAESLSPEGNDDAVLRWNACARTIMRRERIEPAPAEPLDDSGLVDDVPLLK